MARRLKINGTIAALIMGTSLTIIDIGPVQSATEAFSVEPSPSINSATISVMPIYPLLVHKDLGQRIMVADDAPITAGSPLSAPLKWAGLYYFKDEKGENYACTAQFITPRIILMAAHCVENQDTAQYYPISDKTTGFLLQYQNQDFTKRYHVICRSAWNNYNNPLRAGEDPSKPNTMSNERREQYLEARNKAHQWDYGFALLDGDSLTGHYNYKINVQAKGATATGYPAAIMGGEVIQRVEGDVFREQDVAYTMGDEGNEQVLWHGIPNFTGGASGGAWVANISDEEGPNNNIIIGLNSFHNAAKLGLEFSPVFTDDFESLLRFTANGCKR